MTADQKNGSDSEGLVFALRHRRLIVGVALGLAALTAVVFLVLPRRYVAIAVLTPEAQRSPLSQLAGLAAQLGVAVPNDQGNSPQFYADLAFSDVVLREVIKAPVLDGDGGQLQPLADRWRIRRADSVVREELVLRRLREQVLSDVNVKTNVVTLRVNADSPTLASELARRLVASLDRFNRESRRTQAKAEREFVAARVAEARAALRQSEAELERFLSLNREFRSSPRLLFAYERLQREVAMKQAVATTLEQSYEQARIAEVRDTPVLTVLQDVRTPALPESRHLILKTLVAFLVGGLVGVGVGVGLDARSSFRRQAWDPELTRLGRAAVADVRKVVRLGGARRSGSEEH